MNARTQVTSGTGNVSKSMQFNNISKSKHLKEMKTPQKRYDSPERNKSQKQFKQIKIAQSPGKSSSNHFSPVQLKSSPKLPQL